MVARSPRNLFALIVLLGAYATAAFLVATRPGATLSADERTVIRLAHWQIEAGPREAIDAVIARYEELNPAVRVEQVTVPGSLFKQWLRTQLIGGNATDIIEFGSFWGGVNDIPPRFFDPITREVEAPNHYNRGTSLEGVPWRDTFRDGLNTPDAYIENLSNYFAVTLTMTTMRAFYNPELLLAITGSAKPPTSYREVRELTIKLADYNQRTGQKVTLYAGSQFTGETLMIDRITTYSGLGLSMYNDRFREQGTKPRDSTLEYLRGRWNFDHPALRDALELAREGAAGMRPGFQQLGREAAVQEFMRSQTVMIITGTWDATSLRKLAPFELTVEEFPWPKQGDGKFTDESWGPYSEGAGGTTAAFYLNKASQHKEVALDFMRFMTSVEGNGIFVEKSGWLPSVREVEVPDYAKAYMPHFAGYSARLSIMRGYGNETRDVWSRQLHRLISPNGSVDSFLEAFRPEFREALVRDLQTDLRNVYLSLRRDLAPLTALAMLDLLEDGDAHRESSRRDRESSQTIIEAKLYEAEFVLPLGPAMNTLP